MRIVEPGSIREGSIRDEPQFDTGPSGFRVGMPHMLWSPHSGYSSRDSYSHSRGVGGVPANPAERSASRWVRSARIGGEPPPPLSASKIGESDAM